MVNELVIILRKNYNAMQNDLHIVKQQRTFKWSLFCRNEHHGYHGLLLLPFFGPIKRTPHNSLG